MVDHSVHVVLSPLICMVCGILGNSLSFVITFLWFKHLQVLVVQREGFDFTAPHPPMIFCIDDCYFTQMIVIHFTMTNFGNQYWCMDLMFENEIFISIFRTLQVPIRALVWRIRAHSWVCLNSNSGIDNLFERKVIFKKIFLQRKGCDACDHPSSSKWFLKWSYMSFRISMLLCELHVRLGLRYL